MKLKRLRTLRDEASGYADHAETSDAVREAFDEGEAAFEAIDTDGLDEWLSREYRGWFRDWKAGEADPPCDCSNPRCPLKRGRMFYDVRRPSSAVSNRDEKSFERRIRETLDDHPDATVLDAKLRELREHKQTALRCFREAIRLGMNQTVDTDTGRDEVTVS